MVTAPQGGARVAPSRPAVSTSTGSRSDNAVLARPRGAGARRGRAHRRRTSCATSPLQSKVIDEGRWRPLRRGRRGRPGRARRPPRRACAPACPSEAVVEGRDRAPRGRARDGRRRDRARERGRRGRPRSCSRRPTSARRSTGSSSTRTPRSARSSRPRAPAATRAAASSTIVDPKTLEVQVELVRDAPRAPSRRATPRASSSTRHPTDGLPRPRPPGVADGGPAEGHGRDARRVPRVARHRAARDGRPRHVPRQGRRRPRRDGEAPPEVPARAVVAQGRGKAAVFVLAGGPRAPRRGPPRRRGRRAVRRRGRASPAASGWCSTRRTGLADGAAVTTDTETR